jgi:hypothetical protein
MTRTQIEEEALPVSPFRHLHGLPFFTVSVYLSFASDPHRSYQPLPSRAPLLRCGTKGGRFVFFGEFVANLPIREFLKRPGRLSTTLHLRSSR